MNPVFFLLVIVAAVLLWFLLSFAFIPFGKMLCRLWKEAHSAMNKKFEEEKGEDNK